MVGAAAGSLGGRPADYSLVEDPITVLAWMLMTGVVAAVLLLPLAVGEERAMPFRVCVSCICFPLVCHNHYQ